MVDTLHIWRGIPNVYGIIYHPVTVFSMLYKTQSYPLTLSSQQYSVVLLVNAYLSCLQAPQWQLRARDSTAWAAATQSFRDGIWVSLWWLAYCLLSFEGMISLLGAFTLFSSLSQPRDKIYGVRNMGIDSGEKEKGKRKRESKTKKKKKKKKERNLIHGVDEFLDSQWTGTSGRARRPEPLLLHVLRSRNVCGCV